MKKFQQAHLTQREGQGDLQMTTDEKKRKKGDNLDNLPSINPRHEPTTESSD